MHGVPAYLVDTAELEWTWPIPPDSVLVVLSRSGRSIEVVNVLEKAVAAGAKIIVAGWATERYSRAVEDGIRLATANGVLVVAAAGDGGQDLSKRPYYPAALASSISGLLVVAGFDESKALTRAPGMYSNFGPSAVELAAPGGGVRVPTPRGDYADRSSTGIAAGFAAGAAALVWSRCPKLSASEVKAALLSGARAEPALRDEVAGNRALDVFGALAKAACR